MDDGIPCVHDLCCILSERLSVMKDLNLAHLISALHTLEVDSIPKWGVMTAPQMLRHCNLQIKLYSRKSSSGLSSLLLTYTMGRLHLLYVKYFVRYDIHRYSKNSYSLPTLKTAELTDIDFDQEREELIGRLTTVSEFEGRMRYTPLHGWVSRLTYQRNIYVHVEYHLHQFGVL